MSDLALKPCPFCGFGKSIPGLWLDDTARSYRVNCGACGAGTGFRPGWTEGDATRAWNTRPEDPEITRLREEVERLDALRQQGWGALNFILAFYEPGQRYLDTNAWTQAEAGGRRALAALEARSLLSRIDSGPTPEAKTPEAAG